MIYDYGGKKYLLLTPQCQIEKNRQDIAAIINDAVAFNYIGMKVVGQVDSAGDLPKKDDYEVWPYEYGDAFAVGTSDPYTYYLWTRAFGAYLSDHWFNIGIFPAPSTVPGPAGPTGATGSPPNLTIGSVTSTLSQPQVSIEGTTPNYTLNFKLPKGDKGDPGTNGRNGVDGKNGKDGTNAIIYTVKGAVDTVSQLPAATSVSTDTAYLVTDGNLLYGIMVKDGTNIWYNYGPTSVGPRGPAGVGTTDLNTVQFPYGEQSITFDDTDGLSISATGKFSYDTETVTPQMTVRVPLKAGEGITMDADADNKSLVIKNADHAELAKKVDLIDNLTDNLAVVYGAQRRQNSDGSYYYDRTPIRVGISTVEGRSLVRRREDGSALAATTTETNKSSSTYAMAVVNNQHLDSELDKKLDKKSTDTSTIQVYGVNGTTQKMYTVAASNTTGSTVVMRGADGGAVFEQGTSLKSAVILNTIEPVVITPSSSASTNGTITTEQLARLQQTALSSLNTKPGIFMNNEYYTPMDKGHTSGYLGYTHIGYENGSMIAKNITITISTRAWVLNTVYVQPKLYNHTIIMQKTPYSDEDGYYISFQLKTKDANAYTTYSQMLSAIGGGGKYITASGTETSGISNADLLTISAIYLESNQFKLYGTLTYTDGTSGYTIVEGQTNGLNQLTFTDSVFPI